MNELNYQNWVINTILTNGGYAHKMSHRFIIGVSDLMIKLPKHPATLLEVKLQHIGITTSAQHCFQLDVTKIQQNFLLRYYNVGMACGVMSFIERGRKGRRAAGMQIYSMPELTELNYRVQVDNHQFDLTDASLYDMVDAATGSGRLQRT